MNQELYYQITTYLGGGKISIADEWRKKIILRSRQNFEYQDGELYKISQQDKEYRRIVIPTHRVKNILSGAHDYHLSGHQGAERTYQQLAKIYWWPQMWKDVQHYIRTCDICQKRKTIKDFVPRQPSTTPNAPFEHIGIDVIGPLPRTLTGKKYIVVAVDWLTKWPEAESLETSDAQTISEFIHERIICQHGLPRQITSDRGTEFCNDLVKELNRTYRIQHIRTTAYHPQGNGLTERMNQTIKNTISKMSKTYTDWDFWLPSALFAIRCSQQKTTTFSPFELVYGRLPNRGVPQADMRESHEERIWSLMTYDMERLKRIRNKAQKFIQKVQDRQKYKNPLVETLNIGDQILIYRNIVEASWSAKLEPKWEGPYYIQDMKGTSIWIRSPKGTIQPTPVHRGKVKRYFARN